MRLGRWEVRWNWAGWSLNDEYFTGRFDFAPGLSSWHETVWWFGPLELWRYND